MSKTAKPISKAKTVRWAILGTGLIANAFARDIHHAAHATLTAICSRNMETAKVFAAQFSNLKTYDDPEALSADGAIDAVYIASLNSTHIELAVPLLQAGKHVLIEKPLATSLADAERLHVVARETGRFAMEGMWTLFLPAVKAVRASLDASALGTIRSVEGGLAYEKPFDTTSRFYSPELGGGSLLDLGIYPLAMTLNLFGSPRNVAGEWTAAPSGVDVSASISLAYDGFDASLSSGFHRTGANHFIIRGDKGTLIVDRPFLKASQIIRLRTPRLERLFAPSGTNLPHRAIAKIARMLPLPGVSISNHGFPGSGLQFEIEAASNAILDGKTEHATMPIARSIDALAIIEQIRALPPS